MNEQIQKKFSDASIGYVSVFSADDWNELDSIVNNLITRDPKIFETPKQGDSRNEYVDLSVARFIVRKNGQSKIVNTQYTFPILNILSRTNFIKAIEQKTKLKNLKILRMQLNSMKKNSFVGLHTDSENDPAFETTAVIRTASSYDGGELCLYGNTPKVINQPDHSVFFMDSRVEHEVKMVTNGYRNSLIVVMGSSS